MAQLRQDYTAFVERDAVILVVGPEGAKAFAEYWEKEALPFIGLPDPKHSVLKLYGQEVKLFKLGRMPAAVLVDPSGTVRLAQYGSSMRDVVPVQDVLDAVSRAHT